MHKLKLRLIEADFLEYLIVFKPLELRTLDMKGFTYIK